MLKTKRWRRPRWYRRKPPPGTKRSATPPRERTPAHPPARRTGSRCRAGVFPTSTPDRLRAAIPALLREPIREFDVARLASPTLINSDVRDAPDPYRGQPPGHLGRVGAAAAAAPDGAAQARHQAPCRRCPHHSQHHAESIVGPISVADPEWATSMRRAFAFSASGMVTVSTPFSYVAAIFVVSTPSPRASCRR